MSVRTNAGFPRNIFKWITDRFKQVDDDLVVIDEDITAVDNRVTTLQNSLSNWIKTQDITATFTLNAYSTGVVEGANLNIPSGYTLIGLVITNNTNPTKVSPTYSIKYENSKYRTFILSYNYSADNNLTTTIKLKAIYLKNSIS